MRRFGLPILILLLLVGAAFWWAPRWTPSRSAHPVQGIDVSSHQGAIDWARLRAQRVDFAYIKASEGGDFRDRAFARNWDAAGRAGIRRGAYHFFTLCRPGADQAANFLAVVPPDATALPPAVDLEFLGNCTKANRMTPADLRRELSVFLQTVEARTGQPTLLYLTREFDDAYRVSVIFDRPLWLRRIILEPRFGARRWTLWQASNFRRLDGIDGRVDWNVARLTWPPRPPHSQP
ncbi:MAG TPA: GH25 family lysozyme [Sphingomicrobium sp.]|jgi:lysozyme|nr:GH25 family lysozyme [Sphingomicrobium sp.]